MGILEYSGMRVSTGGYSGVFWHEGEHRWAFWGILA